MFQDDHKQVASPVPDWYVKAMSDGELSDDCARLGDAVSRLPRDNGQFLESLAMRDQIVLEQAERRAGRSGQVSPVISEAEAFQEAARYTQPMLAPKPLEAKAPADAEDMAAFLKASGITYRGTTGTDRRSTWDQDVQGWNGLPPDERDRRIAATVYTAFDAIGRVVKVDGGRVAGKMPLAVHVESLDTMQPPTRRARIGCVYAPSVNTFAVDMNSNDSLIHEFGHYLDFAAGSRYNDGRATRDVKPVPGTAFVPAWRKFVDDLKDTQAHHHFVFTSGLDPHYTQMASEVLARFFEGWVMHENLKRGIDLFPGNAMVQGSKGRYAALNNENRNQLNHEPYAYDQFERFGTRFRELLKESETEKSGPLGVGSIHRQEDLSRRTTGPTTEPTSISKPNGITRPAASSVAHTDPKTGRDTRNDFVLGMDPNFLLRLLERIVRGGTLGIFFEGLASVVIGILVLLYPQFCGTVNPDANSNGAAAFLWFGGFSLAFAALLRKLIARPLKARLDRADGFGPLSHFRG